MRNILELSFETQKLLKRIEKNAKKAHTRRRASCILLSYKGFSISTLSTILSVHLNSIYNYLNGWEKSGLLSFYNTKGAGRKLKIGIENKEFVRKSVQKNPRQLNLVLLDLAEEKGIKVSKKTLIRYLKKNLIFLGQELENP